MSNEMEQFREKYLKSYVVTAVDDSGEAWTFVLQFENYPGRMDVTEALEEEQDMTFETENVTFFPLNDVMPFPKRTYRYCVELKRELEEVIVEHFEFDHEATKEEIVAKMLEDYSFDEKYDDFSFYQA